MGLACGPGLCVQPCAQAPAQTQPRPAAHAEALSQPPRAWAEAGAANQERIIDGGEDVPLRFRVHKVDAHGETLREVIESRDGNVARAVQRGGMALTAEEDAAERDRLNDILSDPEAYQRRRRRERAGKEYALELVRALPTAMLWSYAPGQPQLPHSTGWQVVLNFTPDAHFKPPTLVTEGLTGIAGRVWIDGGTRCVVRVEGTILRPVDFGWGGMLARVKEGGRVELEQTQAAEHRWFYSHLSEHLTLREMLVRTVSEDVESEAWGAHPLPAALSLQDAIHELLALPVPTR